MTNEQMGELTRRRPPLRIWPGVIAVALQWVIWLVVPAFAPETGGFGVLGAVVLGLVVLIWWLFFSRAAWSDRFGALAVIVVAIALTARIVHESIADGMMGFMLLVYSIPLLSLALVASVVLTRRFSTGARRAAMIAAIVLACIGLTVVRTEGITGDADSDFEWRWTPTAEQQLVAAASVNLEPSSPMAPPPVPSPPQMDDAPAAAPAPAAIPGANAPATDGVEKKTDALWPGFRGPLRDSVIRGVRIETDWTRTPPTELWRRAIGPGWSSFAVHEDVIYTQEQRGDDEIVSAYSLKSGNRVWRHRDAARFWESNAGAGPRATPTVANGRVYTVGATGIINALDARTGSRIWSRNAATDTGATVPDWGIASSPLVIDDVVIAAPAGWLVAYDAATGTPRWYGPKEGWGYSSPQLVTLDGVSQIVLVNGPGAIGVSPSEGTVLWTHEWAGDSIVQPGVLPGGDLLIGSGSGLAANSGMRRVTVARDAGGWTVKERWTTTALKPYFNDFVVHAGHAYGFDGSILACIDLNDGARKWKGGRYGHGQLALMADQGLLLVLSEDGELALVNAAPDTFTEVARYTALEGKTWNHPVVVGDVLLVRNGEEMAAFRLPVRK